MSSGKNAGRPKGSKNKQKKLPAFQFYTGDWMKDANLRRCTHAAKGVWIDILCLMFDSEERGVLVSRRRAWDDDEIVLAVGGDSAVVRAGLEELTSKGVAARRKDGALYSKRMVDDEDKRRKDRVNGSKGGNKDLLAKKAEAEAANKRDNQGVNPNINPEIPPSSSSSSSDDNIKKEENASLLAKPQDVEEALAYAGDRPGYQPEVVRHWYASRDSAGWERVNGVPVRNWRSDLDAWVLTAARQSPPPTPRRSVTPANPTRTSAYSW